MENLREMQEIAVTSFFQYLELSIFSKNSGTILSLKLEAILAIIKR